MRCTRTGQPPVEVFTVEYSVELQCGSPSSWVSFEGSGEGSTKKEAKQRAKASVLAQHAAWQPQAPPAT